MSTTPVASPSTDEKPVSPVVMILMSLLMFGLLGLMIFFVIRLMKSAASKVKN